jgi:hypothetical protein
VDTPQIDDFLLWAATIVVAVTAIAGGLVALYRLLTSETCASGSTTTSPGT